MHDEPGSRIERIELAIGRSFPWILVSAVGLALLLHVVWPIALAVILPLLLRGYRMRGGRHLTPYRRLTPGTLIQSFFVVLVIMSIGIAVLSLENPILSWGWYSLVSEAIGGGGGAANVVVVPLSIPWLAMPFLGLLLWLLPDLAATEERVFRLGTQSWRDGLTRSIGFAAAHLVMGIPIGIILPLIVTGLWLTWHYFQGGTERSTRYHLAYNLWLIGLATLVLFVLPVFFEIDG